MEGKPNSHRRARDNTKRAAVSAASVAICTLRCAVSSQMQGPCAPIGRRDLAWVEERTHGPFAIFSRRAMQVLKVRRAGATVQHSGLLRAARAQKRSRESATFPLQQHCQRLHFCVPLLLRTVVVQLRAQACPAARQHKCAQPCMLGCRSLRQSRKRGAADKCIHSGERFLEGHVV